MYRWVNWTQTPARERAPDERTGCFGEVNLGYGLQEAVVEAQRCLQCPDPACEEGCPNGNPIRRFIDLLAEGELTEAAELDWTRNALPACTGRVCAWERQCEGFCVMNERGDPIKIGALERFFSDWALDHLSQVELRDPGYRPREAAAAVVGAGPAGLAVAHFLARKGYPVTVFERWPVPGGVMAYGIPEFVLPQEVIDKEVARLRRLGVRFRTGVTVGRDVSVEDLFGQGFQAVFLGMGANAPVTLGISAEDLPGVWTAKDFLMRVAAARARERLADQLPEEELALPRVGERVAVVGAGNTAMDAARTAVRLGAREVTILYRRSEEQSPSRPIEVEHARREGVLFRYLVNPTRFLAGPDGRLAGVELVRMRLGEADRSGRPRPVPVADSEHVLPVDTCIVAAGYRTEQWVAGTSELAVDRWGCLIVDEATGATTKPGVFAGGDCVTGPNTVIHAVAAGRRAAEAMDAYLESRAREHGSDPARAALAAS